MAAFLTNFGNSIFEATTDEHQNSLEKFLSKFSSSQKLVDQIDPLATFEVFMKFHPSEEFGISNTSENTKKRLFDNEDVNKYATNLLNNASGGLYDSIFNKQENKPLNVEDSLFGEKEKFNKKGEHTFIEYLAKTNMIVGSENYGTDDRKQMLTPLELQLGYYVQAITVPKIKIIDEKSQTFLGDFAINTGAVIPDNNNLQMEIINTKLPLIERIFYPWMREITMPYWMYDSQPYTTATITIDFSKHMPLQYVFTGCRPTNIDTIQPTQEVNSTITRQVTFTFDFMFITSDKYLVISEQNKDINKLIASGKTLFNTVNKFV